MESIDARGSFHILYDVAKKAISIGVPGRLMSRFPCPCPCTVSVNLSASLAQGSEPRATMHVTSLANSDERKTVCVLVILRAKHMGR
jgi:hypothetical protein